MASSHCKRPANVSFFTNLSDAVSKFAEVVWASPSQSWTKKDLEVYDVIIFGMTPPTSLSANKLFGALHVLGLMFDSPKLKLVVDSAQMWQYKNSVAAVKRDFSSLFGSFYFRREGYATAKESPKMIEKAVAHMSDSAWPTIFYPSLPWVSDSKVASLLGFVGEESLVGLNLDSLLLNIEPPRIGRKDYWSVDAPKSSWLEPLDKVLVYPRTATRIGRKTDDAYALGIIQNSAGFILPPQERKAGTWWNYRMVQALNTTTPITTYWQDTYKFHSSWGALAYQIEDMSVVERQHLATAQKNVYINAIPDKDSVINYLKINLIDSSKERK
jgi:hypothetical protein